MSGVRAEMNMGFVDLHVNGIAGTDFTKPDLTGDDVSRVAAYLYRHGVAGFCPTVITTSMSTYRRCLPVLAGHKHSPGEAKVLGIHVEGPFLSPQDGPRGIHPADLMRQPSINLFDQLRSWADDKILMLTLAPELPGSVELIRHVRTQTTARISIGHTMAPSDAIRAAVDAGATLATHLGNGLASMIHRHYNPLWPLLDDDRLSAMLITDGFHLPADMVRTCLRAKGARRSIVTSDVVHISGLDPGDHIMHGVEVVLEVNGHLHRRGADNQLAGSGCHMLDCMNHLSSLEILNEKELRAVGRTNALDVLGYDGEMEDDLVVYEGGKFKVRKISDGSA